ncbi:hypothetical protein EYF80_029120 [Liparis tanakae]|uniref:Uncharacterized protein n=1 Tax=Liparis tanakae TaxID=230148 RepID=A0A4Z2H460_9TELE|nr:hypothetical protein EYF80_029120 [Liparis tanakae]
MLSTTSVISVNCSCRLSNSWRCRRPSCCSTSVFSPLIQMEKGDVLFSTSSSCGARDSFSFEIASGLKHRLALQTSKTLWWSSEDVSITLFISFTPLTAVSICLLRYFSPRTPHQGDLRFRSSLDGGRRQFTEARRRATTATDLEPFFLIIIIIINILSDSHGASRQ